MTQKEIIEGIEKSMSNIRIEQLRIEYLLHKMKEIKEDETVGNTDIGQEKVTGKKRWYIPGDATKSMNE